MPLWTWTTPLAAAALLAAGLLLAPSTLLAAACGLGLVATVIAAVHHAEVVAHRVGEPFGTLVLALAVTVIEVALIVSMMLAGGPDKAALPRDTIFSAVMIICNGVVGVCLLVGGLHHLEQRFNLEGASSGLAKLQSPAIEARLAAVGEPKAAIGIAIAMPVLLALTFLVGAITLGTGRTNVMLGAVHLVIFAAFLFLALVP